MEQPHYNMRWVVLLSLVASRIVYAVNWFNLSPALPLIASEFRLEVAELGAVGTAFLLGVGVFQIPAGLVAARIGSRNTAMIGLASSSLFAALSGLAPTYEALVVLRFLMGAGMAFFFSPAIGVFSPLFSENERGFAIGIYNSAFSVGGILGFGLWTVFINSIGWRYSLVLAGALGLAMALQNIIVTSGLPREQGSRGFGQGLRHVLRHRDVWLLAVALTGIGGAWFVVVQFIIVYMTLEVGVALAIAGISASLLEVFSVFGSPVGGRISDKLRTRVKLLLLFNLSISGAIAILAIRSFPPVLLAIIIMGFSAGVSYTLTYSTAIQYRDIEQRYAPLVVSIVNSTQLLGASLAPTLFSIVADSSGFSVAWLLLAAASVLPSLGLLATREPFTTS